MSEHNSKVQIFNLKKSGYFKKIKSIGTGSLGEVYLVAPLNSSENNIQLYALKKIIRSNIFKKEQNYNMQNNKQHSADNIFKNLTKKKYVESSDNDKKNNSYTLKSFEHGILETVIKKSLNRLNFFEIREGSALECLKGEEFIIDFYELSINNSKTTSYLLMEYIPNNIRDFFIQNLYNPAEINEQFFKLICKQILQGVGQIHSHYLLHRNLKPENIFYDLEKKKIKISDFGYSRKFNMTEKEFTDVGTVSYKPPDILLGNKFYGCSFDIWSIGVIFVELLIGFNPFFSYSQKGVLKKIINIIGNIDNSALPGLNYFPKYNSIYQDKDLFNDAYGLKNYLLDYAKFEIKNDQFYDMIEKLLMIDPVERITIKEALNHPWFKDD